MIGKPAKNSTGHIFTIGEVVYDIMFKNGHPVAAKPGGSMLNSAISLGRSGLPVSFTGTCGKDIVGSMISGFLAENSVGTSYLHHQDTSSIIALAFLDNRNNATYSFYKGEKPFEQPPLPVPVKDDIVLFGSFYSVSDLTRQSALKLRNIAVNNGSLIIYDPNFRNSHINDLPKTKPFIEENISASHIVRGSDEDFETIFGTKTGLSTWNADCFKDCKALIYTRSSKGVDLFTGKLNKHYDVPAITPLSTIGAGDSFNAGIISELYKNNISALDIGDCPEEIWDRIIGMGINYSVKVCLSYDNYIPAG